MTRNFGHEPRVIPRGKPIDLYPSSPEWPDEDYFAPVPRTSRRLFCALGLAVAAMLVCAAFLL